MDGLGKILRERARTLGLSDSEIARRLGLSQARYHNYVSDTAEPDLGTLVRICRALGTSPDEVLPFAGAIKPRTNSEIARQRVASAAAALEGEALAYTADLDEAMLTVQRGRVKGARRRASAMPRVAPAVPIETPRPPTKERSSGRTQQVKKTSGPG